MTAGQGRVFPCSVVGGSGRAVVWATGRGARGAAGTLGGRDRGPGAEPPGIGRADAHGRRAGHTPGQSEGAPSAGRGSIRLPAPETNEAKIRLIENTARRHAARLEEGPARSRQRGVTRSGQLQAVPLRAPLVALRPFCAPDPTPGTPPKELVMPCGHHHSPSVNCSFTLLFQNVGIRRGGELFLLMRGQCVNFARQQCLPGQELLPRYDPLRLETSHSDSYGVGTDLLWRC